MTRPARQTRLEHFLEAYQPMAAVVMDVIWDRVHRAGCSADDPASIQIAHDTIMEARLHEHSDILRRSPGDLKQAMSLVLNEAEESYQSNRAADRAKLAAHVAETAGKILEAEIPKWEQAFHWRAFIRGIAAIILLGVLCTGVGYAIGRADTASLEKSYVSIALEADAATWLLLQAINPNLDRVISENCSLGQEGHIQTPSGRRACDIPLWLEGPAAPQPLTTFQKTRAHIVSLTVRLPFSIILLLGGLLGIAVSSLWLRLRHS